MSAGRLEAFSDAVIAIIITIMVLELKVPHGTNWEALRPLLPVFISYVLSFIYLGIYWNNHHHMLKLAGRINGAVLWANMHLLFWLSLLPFTTGWMGENHFAALPTALYGLSLLLPALAWFILQGALVRCEGADSRLARALGRDIKGKVSPLLYLAGIAVSFFAPWVAFAIYAVVALIWLVPDQRFERHAAGSEERISS